ncbi:MAG: restriction endonuclease subunit S [Lentisphaeria bacterium]|nr:restriction endonuclease subunit S [Lentisphaeria bacterium]
MTDNPNGYKMTEVGVIPEDWEVKTLGEHSSFRTGPFGSALHCSDYTNDGVPVINPMHIIDGNIFPSRSMTITQGSAHRLAVFQLKAGDIVMGRRGEMGRCAVVHGHEAGWLCGTGSIIIRCGQSLFPAFVQRVLASPRVVGAIEESSVGSTMINLNQGTLAGLHLQCPPLPEQRAIAGALSDVDALLEGLDRLIAKKRDLKQAAMQQLLTGQTRLPGFQGEWKTKRLGDVVEKIVGGGTPSRSNSAFWGNEIPWVTVKDFSTFNPSHTQESITWVGLQNSASNLIPAGTLITSTRMALGKAVVYGVDVAINQDLKALFFRRGAIVRFMGYWFEHFGQMIDDLGSGSTVKGISLNELKGLPLHIPIVPEQTAIASVLSDMDAEIEALERRRAKTADIKQAMMQELLTGKTRLV